MKKFLWLASLACASLASAQTPTPKPTATATATPWVRGDVVTVDAARGRVTLKHEPIKTKAIAMDAMTMPFVAAPASILQPIKVGDKVRFVVQLREGELFVTKIEAAR